MAGVVELISRDLEQQLEDPAFGLGRTIEQAQPRHETVVQKVMVSAIGGILAGVAKSQIGL